MKSRKTIAVGLAAISMGSVVACSSSSGSAKVASDCKAKHSFTTIDKGTLTVALYDLPPFTKVDGKNISGVDGDILAEIGKMECVTITPQPLAAAAVIPSVQSKHADLAAAAWYRTAAREQIVSLSDPLYLDQMAIISKDGLDSMDQLKGKQVGTVDGYLWVSDVKKILGDNLKVYPSTVNMNQDLKTGRIEVALDSFGSGVYNNPNLKVKVIKPDPAVTGSKEAAQACFPISKDNPDLLKAVNDDITLMHQNGKIKQILKDNKLEESAADTGAPRVL